MALSTTKYSPRLSYLRKFQNCITLKQRLVCFLKYAVPVLIGPLWYKVDRRRGHKKSSGRVKKV